MGFNKKIAGDCTIKMQAAVMRKSYSSHAKCGMMRVFKLQAAFVMLHQLLSHKITMPDYRDTIARFAQSFSAPEHALLCDILQQFEFDPMQEQALVQAVIQQNRFDPNAGHLGDDWDDDEDSAAFCAHCINPPPPPLRDYFMWREKTPKQPAPSNPFPFPV
ncbi:hypothetical protein [Kingella kingae]|uniref:hypothetical protein n=2 Tax=Kingella kingae TaxID=504 RepID=UPI0003F8B020